MKRNIGLAVAIALICVAVSAKPTTTITGVVKVAETKRGKVMAVYIADPERGDIAVLRSTDNGDALIAEIGNTVRATGYLRPYRKDSEYTGVIDVLEFERVEPTPSP